MRQNTTETREIIKALAFVTNQLKSELEHGNVQTRSELLDLFRSRMADRLEAIPVDTSEPLTDEDIEEIVNGFVL